MLKSLSSTNIAELLEAELNSIKDIQSVVVKAKLNSRSLKAVANTLDSVKMVIGRISDIIGALNKLKLSNPFKLMQLKLSMKLFTKIVESIDIENTESDTLTITIPLQIQGGND